MEPGLEFPTTIQRPICKKRHRQQAVDRIYYAVIAIDSRNDRFFPAEIAPLHEWPDYFDPNEIRESERFFSGVFSWEDPKVQKYRQLFVDTLDASVKARACRIE